MAEGPADQARPAGFSPDRSAHSFINRPWPGSKCRAAPEATNASTLSLGSFTTRWPRTAMAKIFPRARSPKEEKSGRLPLGLPGQAGGGRGYESRARLSKRVNSERKMRSMVPVGPLRCLATMSSTGTAPREP